MPTDRVMYALTNFIGKAGGNIDIPALAICVTEALAEGLKWNETKPWHLEYQGELVGYVTSSESGFIAVFFVRHISTHATITDAKRLLLKHARQVMFGLRN